MVFVDLKKAYDRVSRDLIWWCLRKKGVPEGYVTIIKDMYNDCETLVSTRAGDTEYQHVRVGLHQGSALSPLLFILIMDVLQAEIGKEPPWVMLFADDLVICEHSRAEVGLQLQRWRETFESHGLRVRREKTEYMPCPEKKTIYIQEKGVSTVKTFKYLGSMFDANGGAEKDVNNSVNIAWSKWRETTGVMCDWNIPTKLKDKVYKPAIKSGMVYGADLVKDDMTRNQMTAEDRGHWHDCDDPIRYHGPGVVPCQE